MPRLEFLLKFFRVLAVTSLLVQCGSVFALDQNKGDIHLDSDLNRIDIVVGSASPSAGCPTGQYWDIGQGRCTTEVLLRTVNVSESCNCSCPSGSSGSCAASRDGSYGVYGWRIPTSGQELVSYNGPTNWGFCYSTSNACIADPPPSPPANNGGGGVSVPVGTVYRISAMICDGSDSGYFTSPADTPAFIRDRIIRQYRSWVGGRCPEASGYINWVGYVNNYAYQYWSPRPGVPDAATYNMAYEVATRPAIDAGADQSGEKTYAGISAANHLCQLAANDRFGPTAQAEYVTNSGNQCIVTVP